MEIEIKTKSLKEIVRKCESLGWDLNKVKIKMSEEAKETQDHNDGTWSGLKKSSHSKFDGLLSPLPHFSKNKI